MHSFFSKWLYVGKTWQHRGLDDMIVYQIQQSFVSSKDQSGESKLLGRETGNFSNRKRKPPEQRKANLSGESVIRCEKGHNVSAPGALT